MRPRTLPEELNRWTMALGRVIFCQIIQCGFAYALSEQFGVFDFFTTWVILSILSFELVMFAQTDN